MEFAWIKKYIAATLTNILGFPMRMVQNRDSANIMKRKNVMKYEMLRE